jgi:hypothetical protein
MSTSDSLDRLVADCQALRLPCGAATLGCRVETRVDAWLSVHKTENKILLNRLNKLPPIFRSGCTGLVRRSARIMTARQARKARRAAEREARKVSEKQQPISEAKLAANRANAEKSTGPKSEEGKARSSRNSFKHGLYSKQLVLPGEDPAALDALKADLRAEHQPANETEEILVNELAEQYWRLRRARRLEAELLSSDDIVLSRFAAVQRMMSSAERGFHKALSTLRQLQKDRGFVPQKQQSGFVPQSDQNRDCEGAATLPADRSSLPAHIGFVPQNASAPTHL